MVQQVNKTLAVANSFLLICPFNLGVLGCSVFATGSVEKPAQDQSLNKMESGNRNDRRALNMHSTSGTGVSFLLSGPLEQQHFQILNSCRSALLPKFSSRHWTFLHVPFQWRVMLGHGPGCLEAVDVLQVLQVNTASIAERGHLSHVGHPARCPQSAAMAATWRMIRHMLGVRF